MQNFIWFFAKGCLASAVLLVWLEQFLIGYCKENYTVYHLAFLLFKSNLLRLLENPALHAKVKIQWNFIFEKNYVPHVFLIFCFLCAGRLEFLVIICHSKTALCFYDLSKNCLLHFTYS